MLTVEFKEKISSNSSWDEGEDHDDICVIIDGFEDPLSSYTDDEYEQKFVVLRSSDVIERLLTHSVSEIKKFFLTVKFARHFRTWGEGFVWLQPITTGTELPNIKFTIDINISQWKNPYSISELEDEILRLALIKNYNIQVVADSVLWYGYEFTIKFLVTNYDTPIDIELSNASNIFFELSSSAIENLLSMAGNDVVTSYFRFPEEIKIAASQYLIYFGQFLRDLGIAAATEIKEERYQTFLKIIPESKTQALDEIRNALTAYLNLPGSVTFEHEANSNNDVAVLQLHANVMHLKGQLALSNAVIQVKDAAIELLRLTNYQLQQSSSDIKNITGETEDIIKDVVSVKKTSYRGFEINLPEILRKLKRKFK